MRSAAPSAEETIRDRIRAKGRITFAEFMELALYAPRGYYSEEEPFGARGDYYTSPMAHPVFGALITVQLEQMWDRLGRPNPFHVVEAGSGNGVLSSDITGFAQRLGGGFLKSLRYVALDRKPRPAATGYGALADRVGSVGFPLRNITGCVLSNELIDSMPVNRVIVREGNLREIYVTEYQGRLVDVEDDPSTPAIAQRLRLDGATLEEGWRAEVGLAAAAWTAEMAGALDRGWAITFDYGDMANRLCSQERSGGTVMDYYRHTQSGDQYARVGRQDITAHANFSTLVEEGRAGGLQPVVLMTQQRFLRNLGLTDCIRGTAGLGLGTRERDSNVMGQRALLKPDGLGAFRVLVQAKGAPSDGLALLGRDSSAGARMGRRIVSFGMPLLGEAHIDLMAGRYQNESRDWDEYWAEITSP